MRLHSFQITNFKSIINTGECKISKNDNIVVLAGQNESGKTSVLEALEFFGNGPSEKFEKFQKRQGTNYTEVRCNFLIGKSDKEYLENEFQGYDDVIKFLKKKNDILLIRKYENGEDKKIEIDKNFFDDFPGSETDELDQNQKNDIQTIAPDKTRETLIGEMNEKIKIDLLPTFSLYSSFEDLLPSEINVSELNKSKAVKDFETVFETKLSNIANIKDPRERKMAIRQLESKATDDFNDRWSQKIDSINETTKYRFTINIDNAEPKKIQFMIEGEDEIPQFLEQRSLGFRWFSAFHLRLRALMKQSEDFEYEENDNNIIILIDEPGQNLHDIAQKDVKKILNETADKQIQIVYSTHNPNLIGDMNTNEIEYTRIRLVTNDKKKGTLVYNIPQFISQKGGGSLDTLSPIRTAMGLNSVGSIFDKNKYNVVVEGITDNYYLSALRDLLGHNKNLHFIPVCGVDNVKSMVGLLIGWGMNYKAVFDDDPKQGRKAYNDLKKHFFEDDDMLAHNHILKIKDCNGIEDIFSKQDFRKFIYLKELDAEEKKKQNSELVKDSKKELVAREFLEKTKKEPGNINLDETSKKKINGIFNWLNEKFEI